MTLDPTDNTVSEIRDGVTDIDDAETLKQMLADEKDAEDRTTAKDAIEDRLDAVTPDEDEPEADRHNPHGELVHVRPPNGGGHIAGFSFEDGETKEVKLNAKVKRALSRGELQLLR